MKPSFVIQLVFFVTAVLIAEYVTSLQCGPYSCGGTDGCCGQTCFNPATHRCYGTKLCGIQDSICGDQCYNVNTHRCVQTNPPILCGISEGICGGRCFSRLTHNCYTVFTSQGVKSVLCGMDDRACGTVCYDPLMYRCTDATGIVPLSDRDKANKPCGSGRCGERSVCCRNYWVGVCYNPKTTSCFNDSAPFSTGVCKKGFLMCKSPDTCYDPSRYDCLPYDNGSILCPKGNYSASERAQYKDCSLKCNGYGCYVPANMPIA